MTPRCLPDCLYLRPSHAMQRTAKQETEFGRNEDNVKVSPSLELGHKYIKALDEVLISPWEQIVILFMTTPLNPNSRSDRGFPFILNHLTQVCWALLPTYSNPRWLHSSRKGLLSALWKHHFFSNSHLTYCKFGPLSSPIKSIYGAYGTCWLLRRLLDIFVDGEGNALFPVSYFKFNIFSF